MDMDGKKSPCKGCDKREIGCHITCKDYISFRESAEALREKIRFEKAKNYGSSYFSTRKELTRKLDRNRDYSV